MPFPMMGRSCFFLILFLSISSQAIAIVSVLGDSSDDVISKTCKSTKYYDLCVSSLKSNSTGLKSAAEPRDLAAIMVRVGMANATATNTYLSSQVVSSINGSSMNKVLKECAEKYSYAIDALQASLQDLGAELYDYAYMHVMAAADYPNACRNGFKRLRGLAYPPELARREDGFRHICDVVLGIIETLGY